MTDICIGPYLPPEKARGLAYRLAKFGVERRLKEEADRIKEDAGPKAPWAQDALWAVHVAPEAAVVASALLPKGASRRDAKALIARIETYRQQFLAGLAALGHVEHYDDHLTRDVQEEAYVQVARRLDEVLGIKGIGWRMRCDTAGPGLVAVAGAALYGKDTLADVAVVYHDAAVADWASIKRNRVHWDTPVYDGGPPRHAIVSEGAAGANQERAGRQLELASERLEVAERLEACGRDGGAGTWRDVVDALVEDARRWEVILGELAVARRLEEEKQEAARRAAEATRREAALRHEELVLRPVAAGRGEEVFRLRVGDGWRTWTGTLHHGAYAISRPGLGAATPAERRMYVVTHLKSGMAIGRYRTKKNAIAVVDRLYAEVPAFGEQESSSAELMELARSIVYDGRL